MNTIEIDRLTKDYGRGRGVFDLTFSVAQGEAFGFLGPNGAGKTTTIRHLMGFSRPQSGSCRIGGLDCLTQSPRIQKDLGYIPGEIALPDEMTGLEFLRFLARYRGVSDFSRAEALMARFELDPRGRIRRMSKGMKQKVGIVCAFMHDPAVLVLDEPTAGLDPKERVRFRNLIASFAQDKIVILSTHIVSDVEYVADEILVMRAGAFIMQGAPTDIVATVTGKVWECHVDARRADELAAASCVSNVHYAADGHAVVRVVADEAPVAGARALDPTLEDVYLYVFRDEVVPLS